MDGGLAVHLHVRGPVSSELGDAPLASIVLFLSRVESPDPSEVQRGLRAAPHRGSQLEWRMLRRAVIGTSNDDGPMTATLAESGGHLAAVGGRIDNAEEIQGLLPHDLVSVDQPSLAQLLLAGFIHWGEQVAQHLRGTYEAIVTDGVQAWCFRDHLGFRPLFYRQEASRFIAATEAKQVVAAAGIAMDPDPEVMRGIFYGDYDKDLSSALVGVRRLARATLLRTDGERTSTRRYWEPERLLETRRASSAADLRGSFDELMGQAVRRVMTGDDAISLSGGIDSPTLAVFAAPAHMAATGTRLPALTVVFPDQPAVDESSYVAEVARSLDLELHTYPRNARPLADLSDWVRLFDGPVPGLAANDVSEHLAQARALGARTMLTGEMAETFVDRRRYLEAHLLRSGRFGALANHVREERRRGASGRSILRRLLPALSPRSLERASIKLRGAPGSAPSWIDGKAYREVRARRAVPAGDRWQLEQLAFFRGPALTLEASEVTQTVGGVVIRRPWADVDLCSFLLSLPAEVKYGGDRKDFVRALMRGRVPDLILDRPTKTYFNDSVMARVEYAQLERWLRNPSYRMPGVRYPQLWDRLATRDLTFAEYDWAKDLAGVHAFCSQWG